MVYSHTRIVTMQVGSTSVSHLLYLPYCRTSEMNQADWAYILGKCAPALRATHAEGRAPLDGGAKTARAQLDAFTRGVFDRFRTGAGGDAGGPLCQEVEQP